MLPSRSRRTTGWPCWAKTWAMPLPMVPAPRTATFGLSLMARHYRRRGRPGKARKPAGEVLPAHAGRAPTGRAGDARVAADGEHPRALPRAEPVLMRRLRVLAMRVLGLFDRDRGEREFAEELAGHLEMHVEDNMRAGMTYEEARRAALIRLGGVEQTREIYRDRRRLPLADMLVQDVRFGLRMMRRSPGFTSVVLLVVALGVGANTVMFSVVNTLLLRPLPYPHASELQLVQTVSEDGRAAATAPPDFYEYRARNHSLQSLPSFYSRPFDLTGAVEPARLRRPP